jgi:beta-fructofuranosidase
MGVERRKTVYLAGGMDYEKGVFDYSSWGDVDLGFNYYAPQTFVDRGGRRVMIGWTSDWAEVDCYGPVQQEGWCGYFALPRRLELASDGRLCFIPVEELQTLRISPQTYGAFTLRSGERRPLEAGDGVSCEVLLRIDAGRTTAAKLTLDLRAGEAEYTRVELDFRSGELVFDRTHSDASYATGLRRCPVSLKGKAEILLHLFLDTCSVEIFTDDYKTAMTGNIFPQAESSALFIEASGGDIAVAGIATYGLAPACISPLS